MGAMGPKERGRTIKDNSDFHNDMFADLGGREAGKASIYPLPLSGCCVLRNLSANIFAKRAELTEI